MKKLIGGGLAALAFGLAAAPMAGAAPPGLDTVDEVNFQEAAARNGFTDDAAGRDQLAIGYEVCALQDEGMDGYRTLTGYVIDQFPNMVPQPDAYAVTVGVIIPASTYLCPRHSTRWENY